MKPFPVFFIFLLPCLMIGRTQDAHPRPRAVEALTLEQALAIAETQHPQLAEARARVDAAAGRIEQAGIFPNPEAILGAQQIPVQSVRAPDRQYIAGFGQSLPLGNRLSKARDAELLEREVRVRGLEEAHRQLRKRVHSGFATALYQESAFQAQNRINTGLASAVSIAKARLDAGDALPEDLARAELDFARAEIELKRSQSLRRQSLISLAATLGDPNLEVKSVEGSLEVAFEVPTMDVLASQLSSLPEWQGAAAEIRASNARIDLAKVERIPDVKVEALYHRLEASRQNTIDLGLSIPLPLFNRNQGRLREARAEAVAAEAKARNTANELNRSLRESHLALTSGLANLKTFRTQVLPRADTILKAAELRFSAGDIALSELLPVRRDWAAVHLSYLEILRDVMQAWAEVSSFVIQPPQR